MGADLYIKNMDRKSQYTGFEVSERAVDVGYFRDCYNEAGLFALLSANVPDADLSWWITHGRKELFNKDGNMSVKGAKQFLSEIEPHVESLKAKHKAGKKFFYRVLNWEKSRLKKSSEYVYDKKYFKTKDEAESLINHAKLLVQFLKLAIKIKSPIIWNV